MPARERRSTPEKLRVITWGLTAVSLLLLSYWLYGQREELTTIRWAQQGPIFLGLVAMYGFSALVNFGIWHARNVAVSRLPWFRDMYLYGFSNLSRRLPSGLGYLLVRTARYPSEGLDGPTVVILSFQELSLQVISGIGVMLFVSLLAPGSMEPGYWFLAGSGILFVVLGHTPLLSHLLSRVSKNRMRFPRQLIDARAWFWLLPYALTWLNGGLMLHWLLISLAGDSFVGFEQVMLMWTFSGTIGVIGGIFPVGQLARDALLSVLLTRYVPLSVAVLAALMFRLVLTFGDLIWSLILIMVGTLTQRRYCQSADGRL